VLEGGGAKLFGHIGALAGIEAKGFKPSHMAGTSSGAIVGALRIAGYTPEEIMSIVNTIDLRSLKDPGNNVPGKSAYNLLRKFGLYEGDFFYELMRDHLKSKGVETFGDLRSSEIGDADDPKLRWRFKCYAADVSRGMLITLPHDLPHLYGISADEYEVATAIRGSMSIPVFYKPVKLGSSYLVDGGLISNFPINSFDLDGEPTWPTFGLLLDEDRKAKTHQITGKIHTYFTAVLKTMLAAHDKTLIDPFEYYHRTIKVPVGSVGTTDFDISVEKQRWLYQNGYDAAKQFLRHWSWNRYRDWATKLRTIDMKTNDLLAMLDSTMTEKAREIVAVAKQDGITEDDLFNYAKFKMTEVITQGRE
jgi:NTE family protein